MMDVNRLLAEKAKKNRPLLVAHRGICGGNIPCNSLQAFQAAVYQGADVVELDIEMSKDGEFFIQHPGMEHVHLSDDASLTLKTAEEIRRLRKLNQDLVETQYPLLTLREALSFLKGKAIVNLDKFWKHPKEIAEIVRELHMEDEVIIKTAAKEEYIGAVEKYAPDMPFMSICRKEDNVTEMISKRNVRYIGTEVRFTEDTEEVATAAYIESMHERGLIVWANSIVHDYKDVLTGTHTDDVSVTGNPDAGWGWLRDRGFDLIQTDFLLACKDYFEGGRN